jgi:ribosome recycling factor
MLDHLMVDAYGMSQPFKQVAQVALKNPRNLSVMVFDKGVR